jgi:hypothetical protein
VKENEQEIVPDPTVMEIDVPEEELEKIWKYIEVKLGQ